MIKFDFSKVVKIGLCLYALITILALTGCCVAKGGFFTMVGILNTICNGFLIYEIYNINKSK